MPSALITGCQSGTWTRVLQTDSPGLSEKPGVLGLGARTSNVRTRQSNFGESGHGEKLGPPALLGF